MTYMILAKVDRGGTLGSAPRGWRARGGWRPARVGLDSSSRTTSETWRALRAA